MGDLGRTRLDIPLGAFPRTAARHQEENMSVQVQIAFLYGFGSRVLRPEHKGLQRSDSFGRCVA